MAVTFLIASVERAPVPSARWRWRARAGQNAVTMRNMPAHGGKSNLGLPEACCYVHFNADETEDLSSSLTSIYGCRFHHQQSQAPLSSNKSLASCERPTWDSDSVGYGLHETGIGFWFPQGDEISLSSKIQTGFGGQQASYLMDASLSLPVRVVEEWGGPLLAIRIPGVSQYFCDPLLLHGVFHN